eukprot:3438285-Rhodomonas_salina.1
MCLRHKVEKQQKWCDEQRVRLKQFEAERQKKKEQAAGQRAAELSEVETGESDSSRVEDVGSDDNESSEHCFLDWNPDSDALAVDDSICIVNHAVSFTKEQVLQWACMDTGANTTVVSRPSFVTEFLPGTAHVSAMSGPPMVCPLVKVGIPLVTTKGDSILFHVPGLAILCEDANAILLAVGPLKRSGVTVVWREGTDRNSRDGGYVQLLDGRRVAMDFHNDLWHLPVWHNSDRAGTLLGPKASALKQGSVSRSNRAVTQSVQRLGDVCGTNRFQALANFDGEPTFKAPKHRCKSSWTDEDVVEDHRAWAHPGTTKRQELLAGYPSLFPKDKATRKKILEFRCPECDLTQGARTYRKTKRQKEKEKKAASKEQRAVKKTGNAKTPASPSSSILKQGKDAHEAAAAATCGQVRLCRKHRELERVRFSGQQEEAFCDRKAASIQEPRTGLSQGTVRLAPDDMLHAFQLRYLHIDYAHSIALGYHNQQYFLIMVIDGVDFMWASPTTTKSDPESLIEEFLTMTRIKIGKLRCDADSTMASSESFKMWARARGIVLCPTAGYQHTMQARAEGAIRIAKGGVRKMLKHSGMPFRFWPWAVLQFCRIYNYWPQKGHAPPWLMLGEHSFSQALHQDLQPFGCYVIGLLSRDSPEVPDTTHSDRGLEGAFLGWDLTTPTVWIWSFRKKAPIRMHDPVFYGQKFPFSDPTVLLNREITVAEIERMRQDDEKTMTADEGEESVEGDETESDEEDAGATPAPTSRPPAPAPFKPSFMELIKALNPFVAPESGPTEPSRLMTRRRAAEALKKAPGQPTEAAGSQLEPEDLASTPQDEGDSVTDPSQGAQKLRAVDPRDQRTWVSGADVPLTAPLSVMSDKQLGRALAHHKFHFYLPKEWWVNTKTREYEACTAVATSCVKVNTRFYLNCSIVSPKASQRHAHELQFALGPHKGFTNWNVRRFLDARFNKPVSLQDLGLSELPGEPGVTAYMAAWTWMAAQRAITANDGLEGISNLEPDPKNYCQALKHPKLAPFWVESAGEEMAGLWQRG